MPRLSPADRRYFNTLLKQFRSKKAEVRLVIGENFQPSAALSREERAQLLGASDYRDLLKRESEYQNAARSVRLVLNPMNGGIGTSLKRDDHLKKIWKILKKKGQPRLGAKGSDLYFEIETEGKRGYISISEAKILRVIEERTYYAETVLEELASSETMRSVKELFNSMNVFARLGVPSPWGKKTYAQILSKAPGLKLKKPLIQAALPTIDEKGKLTTRRVAPGGHGHWGVYFLLQALKHKGKVPEIHAIYNEDGINNLVDPLLIGWMAKEKVPVMMLTTTKTEIDKKGGLLGIQKLPLGGAKKEILEEAQAKEAGQLELFQAMGLSQGRAGEQFFNTNTAVINYAALAPFLQDLAKAVGLNKIYEIVAPKLIQNKKKQEEKSGVREYIQLEGALGSSLLNLDGFLQTSQDTKVRKVLEKHGRLKGGRVDFLRIVNLDPGHRTQFFTPVKTAEDFWLQFKSGAFRFDVSRWSLKPTGLQNLPAPPAAPLDVF